MSKTCADCGCKMYNKKCTNCHEELFIVDQYAELDMPLPAPDSNFMKRVKELKKNVEKNGKHQGIDN